MKIILFGNSLQSMIKFREHVIDHLAKKKNEVYVIAPKDVKIPKTIDRNNIFFINSRISREMKITNEIKTIIEHRRNINKINPDVIISYAIKPSIISMISSRKSTNYNFITGLGSTFEIKKYKILAITLIRSIRLIKKKTNNIFCFLNKRDLKTFKMYNLSDEQKSLIFPGEGVNTTKFYYDEVKPPKDSKDGKFVFLFIGRLIREKGIREILQSCKKLSEDNIAFRCILISPIDKKNPSSIHPSIITKEMKDNNLEYISYKEDVRPYIRESHCIILPSYGEGMPLSLLEGMSMGRPIITTDANGCYELVSNNGLLVRKKSVRDLYIAMKRMTEMTDEKLIRMGENGRKKIIEKYSNACVINNYQKLLNSKLDKE